MKTVYREGGVSVTLTGDLEEWIRRAVREAVGDVVTELERTMQTVADQAEAQWYGADGVQRVTGLSGDFGVTTTINVTRGLIRVSVGSTDERVTDGRIPLPRVIHRAGPFATRTVAVTLAEYEAAPPSIRRGQAKRASSRIKVGDWLIAEARKGNDGKKILPIFVGAPGKAALRASIPTLARIMAKRIEETHVKK